MAVAVARAFSRQVPVSSKLHVCIARARTPHLAPLLRAARATRPQSDATMSFHRRAYVFLVVWCAVLDGVAAQDTTRRNVNSAHKSRRGRDHRMARYRMDLYKRLIKYVFAGVLAPIVLTFAYSLVNDPAVPQIARRLGEAAHEKFSTRLSRKPKAR